MSLQVSTTKLTAANTSRDATGAGVEQIFEARASCYLDRVIFQPEGTNAATVARVFVNTKEPISDGNNNRLLGEVTLPGTTASETAAISKVELGLDVYLSSGQKLLSTLGTAPTAGVSVTTVSGNTKNDFNN